MERIFVWLSGADPTILGSCTALAKSEKIKFAGIGALVLIPAVLGMCSMIYAVSTVSDEPAIFLTAGAAWFFIVLAIDRFMVSTIYKSTIAKRGYWVSLLSRFAFSIFVGLAVSHPLVLLLFNKSISQKLSDIKLSTINTSGQLTAEEMQRVTLPKEDTLKDLMSNSMCLSRLISLEANGIEAKLTCGDSSGTRTCGPKCQGYKMQLSEQNKQIEALERIQEKQSSQAASAQKEIATRKTKEATEISDKFSKDYLARVRALADLERQEPQVKYVHWFILALFVFVDILPITLKLTTPMGEYEQRRDTLLLTADATNKAERQVNDAIYRSSMHSSMLASKLTHIATQQEVNSITQATIEFIKTQSSQEELLHEHLEELIKKFSRAKHPDLKRDYQSRIPKLIDLFIEARKKCMDRFGAYVRGL